MSEQLNIENSIYEFDIILVSDNNYSGNQKAVPINKSSVRYLEVEDNLANIGLVGKIIISNYYGLLQKLNVYNVSSESPNIFIRFKNLDFKNAGAKVIPEVYVLAALGKSTEMGSNVIDRHVAFEFEERDIVNLKRRKINNPEKVITHGTKPPELTIKELFKAYCPEVVQNEADIKPSDVDAISSTVIQFGDSAYDIIKKCYDHLAYSPIHNDIRSPGLVQLENIQGSVKRKLVIKSLAQDITEFFKIAKSGGDASKYLTDKFTVAFSNKSGVLKDNVITKYDIMRVDYEEVFEKKWSNINKKTGNEDATVLDTITYTQLRAAFERLFTSPYTSNLPYRNSEDIKILKYNYPGNQNTDTTTAWATNKVLKSFVYDNIAIVFKVKGQPYRVPGKFIRINIDDPTGANKSSSSSKTCANYSSEENSKEADSLNGWWYVISVQHVFENDIYFNKITAVKIYLPVALPAVDYDLGTQPSRSMFLGDKSAPSGSKRLSGTVIEPGSVEFLGSGDTDVDNFSGDGLLPPLDNSSPEGYVPQPGIDEGVYGPPNREYLAPPATQSESFSPAAATTPQPLG